MNLARRPDSFELSLTRTFDAPRALAFKTWTDPGQLTHWWGPRGMATPYCEMDLRPGGIFKTLMLDLGGNEYPSEGVFLEIVPDERIVLTDAFLVGWRPSARPFMVSVTTFEDFSGRTRMTCKALHWSATDQEEHEAMGFQTGWGESADRFVELVMGLKDGAG